MGTDREKYHHLIPQTYMKPWCFTGESIWAYDKTSYTCEVRNIENICGINYFHSIRAGSLYTNDRYLSAIWGSLSNYHISLNGELLDSAEKMNRNYLDFDRWEILYPNNVKVSKRNRNCIKAKIEQIKINDIEKEWSIQFENGWEQMARNLYQVLVDIRENKPICLTTETAAMLMHYIVMFDWRGYCSNDQFNEVLRFVDNIFPFSELEIPEEDRTHPLDRTALDEMRHNLLVKIFDEFLNDKGVMYKQQQIYEEKLSFVFLLAAKGQHFITSDNPCFTFMNRDHYKEPFFVILPQLAVSLVLKDPNEPYCYKIYELTDNDMDEYNSQIFSYAERLVLSSEKISPSAYNMNKLE